MVDDDPNIRRTVSDILRIKGYEVAVAATGAEAIAAAEREKFSLALIDLVLPDTQGIEVMARIKAISPLTEAIILTGHASMETAIEATGKGAFSYLLKPYQIDELLQKIGHAVERKQAQEEIIRLASFPEMLPTPVIELDPDGEVTYLNPAAESAFPELRAMRQSHPLLAGAAELIAALRQGKPQGDTALEVNLGDATYDLHLSYVPGRDHIRIFAMDATKRKRAEDAIHLLATTDSLTGIANRREFSAILEKEIARSRRYGNKLSLLMYDIDHFKRVNDTYGHDAGDAVLQEMTELVKKDIRAVDTVARWGGEEFLVLAPQLDVVGAGSMAEKLRQEIASHDFSQVGRITISFGVVALEQGDDIRSLLKRVDDALYRAKERGRNRVEILRGEEVPN